MKPSVKQSSLVLTCQMSVAIIFTVATTIFSSCNGADNSTVTRSPNSSNGAQRPNGSYKSEEKLSKFVCWYENQVDSYWPLKMELLSTNPDMFQVYDTIEDEKIALLQGWEMESLALLNLAEKSGFKVVSCNTISDQHALYSFLLLIPTAIKQITGIDVVRPVSTIEILQVSWYAFDGHYEAHLDAFGDQAQQYSDFNGDRIATFIFYMSDVELSASTAFLQGRVAATPVKGSAIFWYGTGTDRVRDESTNHGKCRKILGFKWVANQFTRYYDQFLIRKCSTMQKTRHRSPVKSATSPKPFSSIRNSLPEELDENIPPSPSMNSTRV